MGRGLRILFATFALVILTSCGRTPSTSSPQNSSAIINGQSLQASDPVQSQLVHLETQFRNPESNKIEHTSCTGFIISENAILTAAHCVDYKELISGVISFNSGEEQKTFTSEQIHIHPDYVSAIDRFEYDELRDLAVVKLTQPVKILKTIVPLMNKPELNLKSFSFRALGYGKQQGSFLKKASGISELKQKNLVVAEYNPISPYFESFQPQGGVCFGDSGGPVLIKINNRDYILGVTIQVLFNPSKIFDPQYEPCAEKAVFLNIPYFYDWIQKTAFE